MLQKVRDKPSPQHVASIYAVLNKQELHHERIVEDCSVVAVSLQWYSQKIVKFLLTVVSHWVNFSRGGVVPKTVQDW